MVSYGCECHLKDEVVSKGSFKLATIYRTSENAKEALMGSLRQNVK
jgi:hypothetical protein